MQQQHSSRPKRREDYKVRVCFIAHALTPEHLSTQWINKQLCQLGFPEMTEQGVSDSFKWLGFPIHPKDESLEPVWVDFYIIRMFGGAFYHQIRTGAPFAWVTQLALYASYEARRDGVDQFVVGFGAYSKQATGHGQKFVNLFGQHLGSLVSTTHGDTGTVAFSLDTIEHLGNWQGKRVSILGANGVIGTALTRCIAASDFLEFDTIQLVGKPDRPGATLKLQRLVELQQVVAKDTNTQILFHQDHRRACHENSSDLVIVATAGQRLTGEDIPDGAVVLDLCTPSACSREEDWQGKIILNSGCGHFEEGVLPNDFGMIAAEQVIDLGMGDHVAWGCLAETVALASAKMQVHATGPLIMPEAVGKMRALLARFGCTMQPLLEINRGLMTREDVMAFINNR